MKPPSNPGDPPHPQQRPVKPSKVEEGRAAEVQAARFLESKGYRILQMNWRCKQGEVDIIGEDGETLVFIEVKSRGKLTHGQPVEAVTWRKQARIIHAAALFAVSCGMAERTMRFDVVEILQDHQANRTLFRLLRNAFVPTGPYSPL